MILVWKVGINGPVGFYHGSPPDIPLQVLCLEAIPGPSPQSTSFRRLRFVSREAAAAAHVTAEQKRVLWWTTAANARAERVHAASSSCAAPVETAAPADELTCTGTEEHLLSQQDTCPQTNEQTAEPTVSSAKQLLNAAAGAARHAAAAVAYVIGWQARGPSARNGGGSEPSSLTQQSIRGFANATASNKKAREWKQITAAVEAEAPASEVVD